MTDRSWKGAELTGRIGRALAAFGHDFAAARGANTLGQTIERWAELVIEWNERMDLTAARSADELVDLLVADAGFVASRAQALERSWVDVGSGAGAPGLALALLMPEREFTLVEPKAKRVAFLRSVLHELGRPDVRVERARADAILSNRFDAAISRATLPPPAWVVEGARIAKRTVWVLLAQADPPKSPSGFRSELDERYLWPLTSVARRGVRLVQAAA